MAEVTDFFHRFGIYTLKTKFDEKGILHSISDLDFNNIQDRRLCAQSVLFQIGNLYFNPNEEMLHYVPEDKLKRCRNFYQMSRRKPPASDEGINSTPKIKK